MYYTIEYFGKDEITIRTITNSHFQEIMDDLPYYNDKNIFHEEDGIKIMDNKKTTLFYRAKEKRDIMVMNILASDSDYNEQIFVVPHPANDIYSPISC